MGQDKNAQKNFVSDFRYNVFYVDLVEADRVVGFQQNYR
jgi:hypothetical protein